VVGCGRFGGYHAKAWGQISGVKLVAVCDVVPQRAEALALRIDAQPVNSIAEMARDLDCVSIAVEPERHDEVADECLTWGLHVLLEKPFSTSAETARRLARVAEKCGLVLQAGYVEHFHPTYRRAVTHLGQPRLMSTLRASPRPTTDAIDVVLDLMSHDIEHALEIAGDEAEVRTISLGNCPSTSEVTSAVLSFSNGFSAVLEANYSPASQRARSIVLRNGAGAVSADLLTGMLHRLGTDELVPIGNPLADQLRAFVQSIASNTAPAVTGERAAQVLEIAQTIICKRDCRSVVMFGAVP
jgi:predicted dehydrogenase